MYRNRPQGIKKQQAGRKSTRLEAIQCRKQSISKSNFVREIQTLPSSPHTSNIPVGRKVCSSIPLMLCHTTGLIEASQRPQVLHKPSKPYQKRIRGHEAGHSSPQDRDWPPERLRISPSSCTAEERAASSTSEKNVDPLEYWTRTKRWPKEYFKQDSQVREDLKQDSWLEEQMEQSSIPVVQYVEINGMRYPRPVKKVPSTRWKKSGTGLTGSSDQKKSAEYRDTRYDALLEGKGSFMKNSHMGITDASKSLCRRLLESEQDVPKDSLFRDDLFDRTCQNIQGRNEAMIIKDITWLIVPSAKDLATYGAGHLDHLIENVNEGWTGSIPVEGPRPQPDYSVGFGRSSFTDEQLKRLDTLVGSVFDTSFFVATYRMYFPFLTCEVKCGAAGLDIADRQNAHSMTLAVRGVVELYRTVKREKELHREILAFSISHDHSTVRIYGHYAIIVEDKTTFYRHPIHKFDFTALDGRDKWTAYKFTKNVYDIWMPLHFEKICSALDDLPPDIDFGIPQSASFPQAQTPRQSNAESTSMLREDDSHVASQDITPTTSFSQEAERVSKKPKNNRTLRPRR
ncbi:hypothetical protein OEA41_004314 [Lepraria neglecta]|uniref:DUF7924 domain-containing protein n=1 Tax=Lepraria neglecta TaxID=209136 RepID=A0AAD9YZX3_9LECA|nr:hypothetical protein OEA41_004314 [Lepraria neglecta]